MPVRDLRVRAARSVRRTDAHLVGHVGVDSCALAVPYAFADHELDGCACVRAALAVTDQHPVRGTGPASLSGMRIRR